MKLHRRAIAALLAGGIVLGGPAALAGAATYSTPDSTVGRTVVLSGATVSVTWGGFQPNSLVDVHLHSDPIYLGTFQADATGTVRASVVLPAGVTGDHHLVASGIDPAGQPISFSQAVTIEAAPTATPSGNGAPGGFLPRTGAQLLTLVGVGGSLVLAGGAVTATTRRRRDLAAD